MCAISAAERLRRKRCRKLNYRLRPDSGKRKKEREEGREEKRKGGKRGGNGGSLSK